MVPGKNMKKFYEYFFILIFISFFSNSCSYKENTISSIKTNNSSYKSISLNVSNFIVKQKIETANSTIENRANEKKISNNIENWANNKFKVEGKSNSATLEISDSKISLLERQTNKGFKKLFFMEFQEKYLVETKLKFILSNSEKESLETKLIANIEYVINDKMSLIDKEKAFVETLDQLTFKIDQFVNKLFFSEKLKEYLMVTQPK